MLYLVALLGLPASARQTGGPCFLISHPLERVPDSQRRSPQCGHDFRHKKAHAAATWTDDVVRELACIGHPVGGRLFHSLELVQLLRSDKRLSGGWCLGAVHLCCLLS